MKKYFRILFCLLLSSSASFGQEEKDSSLITLSVSISPTSTFHSYKSSVIYPFENSFSNNYGISTLVGYKISNHFALYSGLTYDILQYRFRSPYWNSAAGQENYKYSTLFLPFILQVDFLGKKLGFNTSIGFQGGMFVNKKKILINNGPGTVSMNFDDANGVFMGILRIGLCYRVKKGTKIFISPQILQGISRITYRKWDSNGDAIGYTSHLQYLKIDFGISFRIK